MFRFETRGLWASSKKIQMLMIMVMLPYIEVTNISSKNCADAELGRFDVGKSNVITSVFPFFLCDT